MFSNKLITKQYIVFNRVVKISFTMKRVIKLNYSEPLIKGNHDV